MEHHGTGYRVRLRHAGRLMTDGTFHSQVAAQARVSALHAATRLVPRQLDPGPPPTLHQWVRIWLPAHTAAEATLAKYRSLLRDGPSEPGPTATARQVNAIAARMPHRHASTLIITAAYTGMRFGELAALTRTNLHLDQARLHVIGTTGALHEVSGKRRLGPPKTKASVRDIRLPAFLIDGLEQLLRAHPYDTVFCTESGTWLWRTTFVQRIWRPACDGHPGRMPTILPGLRFHDLRHTHRTWLDEDNLPDSLKSQRLGHRIPGIHGVYAHVTEPMHPPLLTALHHRWLDAGGTGNGRPSNTGVTVGAKLLPETEEHR